MRIHTSGITSKLIRNWSEFKPSILSDLCSFRSIWEEKVLIGMVRPLFDWIGKEPKTSACAGEILCFCTISIIGELFSFALLSEGKAIKKSMQAIILVAVCNSFNRRLNDMNRVFLPIKHRTSPMTSKRYPV